MKSNAIKRNTPTCMLIMAFILGLALSPLGVQSVQAQSIPTVTVSCRIEPAQVRVGEIATLYVDVSGVPAFVNVGGVQKESGMNVYDMELAFATNGAITFLDAAPRPGPAPWSNTFTPAGENVISNGAGSIKAFGMVDPEQTRFFGAANLFSAQMRVNSKLPAAFTFGSVKIPVYNDFWNNYNITVQPCAVSIAPDLPPDRHVFLPFIQR